MKKLLIIFTSIFALAGGIFAQNDVRPDCPGIEITGPSGLTKPGDTADYSVKVGTVGTDLKLEYMWSASSGEIISGQNTPAITVRFGNDGVTVTVEIKGLPEVCPNMASENSGCGLTNEKPELLDTFPGPVTAKEKTRFKKMYDRLEADPNARGVIFVAGTERQIKANKQMIVSFITSLHKDGMRVTFVHGPAGDEVIEFWLVPSGASEPNFGIRQP